jgi:hypothetical protein
MSAPVKGRYQDDHSGDGGRFFMSALRCFPSVYEPPSAATVRDLTPYPCLAFRSKGAG